MTTGTPNILISSGGRRVGLAECFRDALRRRNSPAGISVIDAGPSAPLAFKADTAHRVPRLKDPGYLDEVSRICAENAIRLLVPTIDTELAIYANARDAFAAAGTTISISGPRTVAICGDKTATHEWLIASDFPTVGQTTPEGALSAGWKLPLIAKPRNGSASIGVRKVETLDDLCAIAARGDDGTLIQEIADGKEFTINVYVNRAGRCICAVPHWRIETRGGEVSKGVTVKDEQLMALARSVAEALPDAWGALNIQCFRNSSGVVRIIEINARFGGGYPLAHQAGGRFADWLLDEIEGVTPGDCDAWVDDLAMLRYDEAIYLPGASVR
jgi:carbamoyl-phosphate synthase large subunit